MFWGGRRAAITRPTPPPPLSLAPESCQAIAARKTEGGVLLSHLGGGISAAGAAQAAGSASQLFGAPQPLSAAQTVGLSTDSGWAHIESLKQLQFLFFDRTQITDSGLEHLKGLTQLQWLDLGGTKATDEGVEKLQQTLPNCEIRHYPPTTPAR